MFRNLTGTLLLFIFFSSTAHATKARLQALGLGSQVTGFSNRGNVYIDDSRNFLLNPSELVSNKNQVMFEAGSSDLTSSQTKGEGGVVYNLDSSKSVLGVYLGGNSTAVDRMLILDNSFASYSATQFPENSIEFFYAKALAKFDMGLSFHYASSSNNQTGSSAHPDDDGKIYSLRGGIKFEKFSLYSVLDLVHETNHAIDSGTEKYEGNPSLEVGGYFLLSNNSKIGFTAHLSDYDLKLSNGTRYEGSTNFSEVRYHYNLVNDSEKLIYAQAGFGIYKLEINPDVAGATSASISKTYIPFLLGVESPLKDWLILRASISQNILIDQTETVVSSTDKTEREGDSGTAVNAGVGMVFDKWKMDATLTTFTGESGVLNASNLFGQVGLSYDF